MQDRGSLIDLDLGEVSVILPPKFLFKGYSVGSRVTTILRPRIHYCYLHLDTSLGFFCRLRIRGLRLHYSLGGYFRTIYLINHFNHRQVAGYDPPRAFCGTTDFRPSHSL